MHKKSETKKRPLKTCFDPKMEVSQSVTFSFRWRTLPRVVTHLAELPRTSATSLDMFSVSMVLACGFQQICGLSKSFLFPNIRLGSFVVRGTPWDPWTAPWQAFLRLAGEDKYLLYVFGIYTSKSILICILLEFLDLKHCNSCICIYLYVSVDFIIIILIIFVSSTKASYFETSHTQARLL